MKMAAESTILTSPAKMDAETQEPELAKTERQVNTVMEGDTSTSVFIRAVGITSYRQEGEEMRNVLKHGTGRNGGFELGLPLVYHCSREIGQTQRTKDYLYGFTEI